MDEILESFDAEEELNDEMIDEEETEDIIVEGYTGKLIKSPLKAIKARCLDCCCFDRNEVKLCPITDCPLWPFRSGKNPYRKKKVYTEEQKEIIRQRFFQKKGDEQ